MKSLTALYLLFAFSFFNKAIIAQNVNLVWAKQFGGTKNDYPISITTDGLGNIYTTGNFQSKVDFDPGMDTFYLNSFGYQDVFISKLNSLGQLVWAKNIGGTNQDVSVSSNYIAIDKTGNVYITGHFQETVDFDPGLAVFNLTSPGGYTDGYILKLDSIGNFVWAKRIGGNSQDYSLSIVLDSFGNIYTTGAFQNTVDFNPGTGVFNLTSAGGSDVFISKLNALGNFVWVKQIGGIEDDFDYELKLDNHRNVYITGHFRNTVDFNQD